MYRNLLIPIAYEPGTTAALELDAARQLVSPGGMVTLLHVMEPLPFYALDFAPEGWRADLIAAIRADMAALGATFPQAKVEIREGHPGLTILEYADEIGADCIVLSTHRADRALLGSTAARVARHATMAVHLLR